MNRRKPWDLESDESGWPWNPTSDESDPANSDRPRVVCICGSTRFKDAYEVANRSETLAGRIVLSVGLFGHLESLDMDGDVKKDLDALHLRKIDLADEILVVSEGGYFGESTSREIRYAISHGKGVRWMEVAAAERFRRLEPGPAAGKEERS